MSKKIKLGRRFRPSYFLILGEREKENSEVSVRNRKDRIQNLKMEEFTKKINEEIRDRSRDQRL